MKKIIKRRINIKSILVIGGVIIFLGLIYGNLFVSPFITNVTTSDSIRYVDKKIVNVEIDNYFFKLDKSTWCILTTDKKVPSSDDKNWEQADNGYCSFIVPEGDYDIYVKDKYGNISDINNSKVKIDKIVQLEVNKDTIYLYKGQKETVTADLSVLKDVDDNIIWSSDNENIAVVDKNGTIQGINYGTTYVYVSVGKNAEGVIKVIVSNLITNPSTDTSKNYITCKQFSDEEAQLLDDILYDRIEQAGYKSRAGVVAAARFLTLEFAYRVHYFYENGRLNNYEPYKYVDGEGRYYHRGLYLSTNKIKDLKATFVGPAIWGCNLQNYTDWGSYVTGKLYPNGLDCSGFVTWALLNGGFDVGDIGAGTDNEHFDLTDLGTKVNITEELMNSGRVKVGDLIGLDGHMAILAGWDETNYYIAESLNTTGGVVMTVVPRTKLVNNSIYTYIILMDNVYKTDGNLNNKW